MARFCDQSGRVVFVALVIKHAQGIRGYDIAICGLSGSTNIFRHYLIKGTILGIKLLNIKRVFWFSLQILSETFSLIRRIQRDIIKNVQTSSCKVPPSLNETSIFLDRRSNTPQISNFMRIRPVRDKLLHTDRQRDTTMLTAAFRNFANAPRNVHE